MSISPWTRLAAGIYAHRDGWRVINDADAWYVVTPADILLHPSFPTMKAACAWVDDDLTRDRLTHVPIKGEALRLVIKGEALRLV